MNPALPLIGAALLLAPASQEAQPMPLEDYRRAEAPGYVVLAPSQEQADKYAQQVRYAIDQFQKYFHEVPPSVTVLIAEGPQTLSLPEVSKLAASGEAFLPFLTEEKLAAARKDAAGNLYMLDAGAALAERDGGLAVVNVFSLPGKPAVELEAGDFILDLNGQDVVGIEDFKAQYARIASGEEVELVVQRGKEVRTVRYNRPENAPRMHVQPLANGEATRLAQARPLSHEVGHVLLMAYANKLLNKKDAAAPPAPDPAANQRAAAARPHSYGHAKLPDWFDEAAATLAEVPELQAQREAFLKEHLEERIPLTELFTMEHPMLALVAAVARENGGQPSTRPRVTALRVSDAGGVMQRASMFYAQSQSFSRFLEERSPRAVAKMLGALLEGKTTADALSDIDGIPADAAELEREWLAWVRER